ncbi:MAG: hypothetical protein ACE145_17830 [Terriglobia bacterium]
MPLCRKTVTPRALEARRENARKSTGPRTAAGKRRSAANGRPPRKPAVAVPTPLHSMIALDEDPSDYKALLFELLIAHHPTNPAQRLLIEDIAMLRWRRLRNLRAQEGLTVKNLERLERDRLQQEAEMEKESSDFSQKKALEMGMFNIPDSPAKFKELGRLVDMFIEAVERREFTEKGYRLMASVYGPEPSTRGARILTAYHYLAQRAEAAAAYAAQQVPAPADPQGAGSSATPEAVPPQDDEAAMSEQFYRDLRIDLLEERRDINERHLTWLQNHVPSVASVRSDAVMPSTPEWPMLMRQEQLLDREIERKTKLLLYMQWAQRRRRRNGYLPYTLQNREVS